MKKLTTSIIGVLTVLGLSLTANTSFAMNSYVEFALIKTCKSTLTNSKFQVNKTLKAYNLKMKTVALKVMCNGENIIAFAERYGANKTAAQLQNSIGNVEIIDVASSKTVNVNFEINAAN